MKTYALLKQERSAGADYHRIVTYSPVFNPKIPDSMFVFNPPASR
jgi:hypothetical protein